MRASTSSIHELTARDRAVLDALTRRVRTFSVPQVAEQWWPSSTAALAAAADRLAVLERRSLVHCFEMLAHPLLNLAAPLAEWRPGQPQPDFQALSYRLQSRWSRPSVLVKGCIATSAAASLCAGCGGRHPRPSEYTHDLHLAAVYLHYFRLHPAEAATWSSEAMTLRERGRGINDDILPDATVADAKAPAKRRAVEFGGAYAADKLEKFHAVCAERGMPYEIW